MPARVVVLTVTLLAGLSSNATAQTTLVPIGAAWKFLADGSDQGTAWRAPEFDDAAWTEGRGKLGYGEENQTTVVGFGANPETKFITTYFRHAFTAVDAKAMGDFLLRLLRDDGAIVYLNGVEVYRSNMPEGAVTFTTPATAALGTDEEVVLVSTFFKENHLKEGRNVLAVEIHQSDPASSDMAFDLELLTGFRLAPPTVSITSPLAGDTVVEGPVVVTVDATFVGGDVTSVTLMLGETVIGKSETAPFEFAWVADAGEHTLTAMVTTSAGLSNRSDPLSITVLPTLIRQGSVWKYLADGTNQGKAWRAPDFDDASWSDGAGELGYGDGDEKTIVPSGADSTNNYITTYFRKSFTVDDLSDIKTLMGVLTYDDGAVVYLNGTEIFRINMPAGDPAFNAPATSSTDYEPAPFTVDPKALRKGQNVIAVEVHQSSATSSDVSFDLMLRSSKTVASSTLFLKGSRH
jgi:hypothetical protein